MNFEPPRFMRTIDPTVEDLLQPCFRRIADEMQLLHLYKDIPFTQEMRELFDKDSILMLENVFRDYLTNSVYHEYSLG